MDNSVRDQLRQLLETYGLAVIEDRRRCEALLRDLAGEHRREVNVVLSALSERVPQELLNAQGRTPTPLLLQQLTRRLQDNQELSVEGARWAVGTWAAALGVATSEELEPPGRSLRESLNTGRAEMVRLFEERDKLMEAPLERGRELLPRVARGLFDRAPGLQSRISRFGLGSRTSKPPPTPSPDPKTEPTDGSCGSD
jgi:hypothetical protein